MPAFIETQFPIARLSAESYKKRKANQFHRRRKVHQLEHLVQKNARPRRGGASVCCIARVGPSIPRSGPIGHLDASPPQRASLLHARRASLGTKPHSPHSMDNTGSHKAKEA